MCKRLRIYSVLAFSLFLGMLFACKTEEETRYVEIDSTADGVTVKNLETLQEPADTVLHYVQDVLVSATDGKKYVSSKAEAFSLQEFEIKKVLQSEKLKDLAKAYQGFSYAWGTQKGKTVYLYYTRKTVTYSFYNGNVLIATRQGTYGLECTPPPTDLGEKKYAKTWNTKTDGSGTDLGKEFGAVDALYYPKGTYTIIGTKLKPQSMADIVFSDGSAASTQEVSDAKAAAEKSGATQAEKALYDTYKNNAIAMIVFVSYNPDTGRMDGNKMIGVGLRCFDDNFADCLKVMWRESSSNDYMYEFPSFHGLYDHRELKLLLPEWTSTEGGDSSKMKQNYTAMYYAETYPTLCESKMGISITSDELKENWYLPSYREIAYVVGKPAGYYNTLANAATVLGLTSSTMGTGSIFKNLFEATRFWSTAAKSGEARAFDYQDTYDVPTSGDGGWRYSYRTLRVIPFKVFK